MPQLTRLRLVNVGHQNARMDDLTLDFRNQQGGPIDSTIWLRNGGGKSSILNLFFSLINPNRNQFLGSKADQGERVLEDYVLPNDRAVVIAEWQLDTPENDPPIWHLIGVFYEWRQEQLERLFFSARVHQPDVTLECIPLRNEQGHHLTFYGFKQAWQNLGRGCPAADAHETENQREWRKMLEAVRLDPDLFGYQLRMNSREGGADDLFRFKDTDHFVDFFLDMVLPAAKSQQISQNLEKFRLQLRDRITQLLPSLDLIARLKPKLQSMLRIATHRLEYRMQVTKVQYELTQLQQYLQHSLSGVLQLIQDVEIEKQVAESAVQHAQHQAHQQNERKLLLQRLQLEQHARHLTDIQRKREHELQDAERNRLVWKAAIPLVDVEKYEGEIRTLEEQIRWINAELAPDWRDVQVTAHALAAALLARAAQRHQSQQTKALTADVQRLKAQQARQDANAARLEAGRADERANCFAQDVALAQSSRVKLEERGARAPNESPETALERRQQTVQTMIDKQGTLEVELSATRTRIEEFEAQHDQSRQQGYEAQQSLQDIQNQINTAHEVQTKLINSAVLSRVLGEVNADSLNRTSLSVLRTQYAEVDQQLRNLAASIAEDDTVLEYLRSYHVLPPSRSVQSVIQFLKDREITASPGWEHISTAYKNRRNEARAFISRNSDLIQGVLVRDTHFERAREVLKEITLHLDAAIVVASRSLAFESAPDEDSEQANTNQKLVIGPTSDAHFDIMAAVAEEQKIESRMQSERIQREQAELDLRGLGQIADQLDQFIDSYSVQWFAQRQSELHDAEMYKQECDQQTAFFIQQRREDALRVTQQNRMLQTLANDIQSDQQHVDQLQTHLDRFGIDEQIHDRQRHHDRAVRQCADLIMQAESLENNATTLESEARQIDRDAKDLEQDANADDREARAVEHLEGLPPPQFGDVHELRVAHRRLCDVLTQKTGGDRLQTELKQARESLSNARTEFESERDQGLTEQDIRTALLEIPERHLVRKRYEKAIGQWGALSQIVGQATTEASTAKNSFEKHNRKHHNVQIVPDSLEQLMTVQELEQHILLAEEEVAQATAEGLVHNEEVKQLSQKQMRLQADKHRIEGHLNLTKSYLNNDDLFEDVLVSAHLNPWLAPLDEDLEGRVNAADQSIVSIRKQNSKLLTDRQKVWSQYLECLGNSPLDFAKSLKRWSEEDFEQQAELIIEQLDTRENNVRAALAESNLHHTALVTELLDIAQRGVKMLEGLARHSSLPETAGMLAGQPFLKIQLATIAGVQEQRDRIGTLINDIVEENETPNGPKLLQRAVRKLSQPIRVFVLFPDIDVVPRYMPITEMSKQSGGERLTSAVLLYCALSRQRARESGRTHNISSSLLLDNPIGAVSRTKFLELQREMARSMHIQLIYATGVNDPEAIRTMPNIVRLRNERRNEKNQSLVEAIRIGRSDENTTTSSTKTR